MNKARARSSNGPPLHMFNAKEVFAYWKANNHRLAEKVTKQNRFNGSSLNPFSKVLKTKRRKAAEKYTTTILNWIKNEIKPKPRNSNVVLNIKCRNCFLIAVKILLGTNLFLNINVIYYSVLKIGTYACVKKILWNIFWKFVEVFKSLKFTWLWNV